MVDRERRLFVLKTWFLLCSQTHKVVLRRSGSTEMPLRQRITGYKFQFFLGKSFNEAPQEEMNGRFYLIIRRK
jgi:hypothetical protein